MGAIKTIKGKCQRCYVCIRKCPTKAIMVREGQASILGNRCISCGLCAVYCRQGAKEIRNDLLRAKKLIAQKRETVAILSPTVAAYFNFENLSEEIVKALKELGISKIYDGTFGAGLIYEEYRKLLGQKIEQPIISSRCTAMVSLVQKHYPQLLPNLAKVVSPMIASGRFIKHNLGNEVGVIYIGPCVAKKEEISDEEVSGAVDVVLTFKELEGIIEGSRNKTIQTDRISGSTATDMDLRRLAQDKGLSESEIFISSGRENLLDIIDELSHNQTGLRFLDLSFCREGCIDSPIMPKGLGLFKRKNMVANFINLSTLEKMPKGEKPSLRRDFHDKSKSLTLPTEGEIKTVLSRLGKYKEEDELNCGACGYGTCQEKAIAICQGIAEEEMCLPNLITHITDEKNRTINTIIESLNDALIVFNREKEITIFNNASSKLTGFSKKEAIGAKCCDIIRSDRCESNCVYEEVLKTERPPFIYDKNILNKEGREIPVHTSFSLLKDPKGRIMGGVEVLRDITKLKEVDRLKSEFVSLVSHELRTPLTSIKGSIDLLLAGIEGELNQDQTTFLNIVKNNTERLIRLISDLLDLSKIESGKVVMKLRFFNLAQAVSETVDFIKSLADEKGISISKDLPLDIPEILADEDRIRQALTNLLSNAIKYTREGGKVQIKVEARDKEIKVSIKDAGIGIAKENIDKIFERFHPVAPLEMGGKSVGLGLTLTKSIIELHGGKIWVESKLNKGSTFSFTLPSPKVRSGEIKKIEKEKKEVQTKGRVLVVDDEPDIVSVIRGYLKKEGYESFAAYSGKEAVEKALKIKPDVITLDLLMPEMDGFEVIERLKGNERTEDIPIIIISAISSICKKKKTFRLGVADYITKPLTSKRLALSINEIRRWINGDYKSRKILIVDNEPDVVRIIEESLSKEGYQTLKAYEGEEALKIAQKENPDLIIADLLMPQMDGFELIKRLKENGQTKHIPVVVLTIRDFESDRVYALGLGAHEYLTKPFFGEHLVAKIEEVLQRREEEQND